MAQLMINTNLFIAAAFFHFSNGCVRSCRKLGMVEKWDEVEGINQ